MYKIVKNKIVNVMDQRLNLKNLNRIAEPPKTGFQFSACSNPETFIWFVKHFLGDFPG